MRGLQQPPPENGGVVAWKFRDPDGHPLERLQTRETKWAKVAQARQEALVLGVDHTAIACGDLQASLAFYTSGGFTPGPPSHNRGAAQDRLDGLQDVDLEIATLYTPGEGPHIELLHDRRPAPPAAAQTRGGDFIRTVLWAVDAPAAAARDPDGHALAFQGAATASTPQESAS